MNDCGKSASIRHELALCAVVELVQSMYGAPVVVLMLDYVRNTGECMAGRGRTGRGGEKPCCEPFSMEKKPFAAM